MPYGKKGPGLAIIVGAKPMRGGKSPGGDDDDDATDSTVKAGAEAAADEIMDAIKSKDRTALRRAMVAFAEMLKPEDY